MNKLFFLSLAQNLNQKLRKNLFIFANASTTFIITTTMLLLMIMIMLIIQHFNDNTENNHELFRNQRVNLWFDSMISLWKSSFHLCFSHSCAHFRISTIVGLIVNWGIMLSASSGSSLLGKTYYQWRQEWRENMWRKKWRRWRWTKWEWKRLKWLRNNGVVCCQVMPIGCLVSLMSFVWFFHHFSILTLSTSRIISNRIA